MASVLPPARRRFAERLCGHAPALSTQTGPHASRQCLRRPFSVSAARRGSSELVIEPPPPPPSRWLAELRARIGKCIVFGCSRQQISQAAVVLRALATEWRELLAGSEGFLTGGRRGLDGREIAWGEMDAFVGALAVARPGQCGRREREC